MNELDAPDVRERESSGRPPPLRKTSQLELQPAHQLFSSYTLYMCLTRHRTFARTTHRLHAITTQTPK